MRKILSTENINNLSEPYRRAFLTYVAAQFDVYEIILFCHERGILSDEQLKVWTAGMCTRTSAWITTFKEQINPDMYLKSLIDAVHGCSSNGQRIDSGLRGASSD